MQWKQNLLVIMGDPSDGLFLILMIDDTAV